VRLDHRSEVVPFAERVVVGGWPGLLGAPVAAAMQFNSTGGYLDMIVNHNIELVSGTKRDPRLVRRFLHAFAQLTAVPSRMSTIVGPARGDTAAPDHAPSRWATEPYLEALPRLIVVDEVPAWTQNFAYASA
jgi:hypothetical protein